MENSNAISITVKNISKSFKATKALENISLEFKAKTMHGVIGPEGSGKTTLMRILLNLLTPINGEVIYKRDDKIVSFEEIRPLIAYMPQQQSLYPDLSIGEHLEFFRALYGIAGDEYEKKRAELLHITRLKEFIDRPAGKLSGGMYKKLGLICALLRSPKVIILDEPTNGVDPISRREFWELLYRLQDEGILIIATTAYMDDAERCSYVHLIEQGHFIDAGEPRALLQKDNVRSFDALFLKRAAAFEDSL